MSIFSSIAGSVRDLAQAGQALGYLPASIPSNLDGEIANLKDQISRLNKWSLTLSADEKSMLSKLGLPSLSEEVALWRKSISSAEYLLKSALSQGEAINEKITATPPDIPGAQEVIKYKTNQQTGLRLASVAENTAQSLHSRIAGAWSERAKASQPGILSYVATPITGIPAAYQRAAGAAGAVGQEIEKAAAEAASVGGVYLKYAAIGLGAFAVLYVAMLLPKRRA